MKPGEGHKAGEKAPAADAAARVVALDYHGEKRVSWAWRKWRAFSRTPVFVG